MLTQVNRTLCDYLPMLGGHRTDGAPFEIHDQLLEREERAEGADPFLIQLTITHMRAFEEWMRAKGIGPRGRHLSPIRDLDLTDDEVGDRDPGPADVMRGAFAEAIIDDLESESNQRKALRKALLSLLFLNDDPDIEAVEDLRAYLLTDFAPLAGSFVNHKHPLLGDEVMRAQLATGESRLLIREEFARRLFAKVNDLD